MREKPRRSLRRLLTAALPALTLSVFGLVAATPAGAQPAAHAAVQSAQVSKVTQNAKALTAPAAQAVHATGKAGQKVPTERLCATAAPARRPVSPSGAPTSSSNWPPPCTRTPRPRCPG